MSLPANCACGRIPTIQSVDQHYPLTEKGKQIPLRKDYRVACRGCGCASPWRKMRESSQVAVLDWNAQMELTKDLSDAARLERFRLFWNRGFPNQFGSDSSCLLEAEASRHGSTLFARP